MRTGRIAALPAVEEGVVDKGIQRFVLPLIAGDIGFASQHPGYPGHQDVTMGQEAVVDKVDGGRVLRMDARRRNPVAQVPSPVFGIGPRLQQAVYLIAFCISQPLLHHRIITVHQSTVTVVDIRLPGSRDDETAPVRAATGGIRVGCRMGHAAVRALAVAPGLHPVEVEGSQIEEGLGSDGRGIAVATIAQALDLRTIDDVRINR